MCLRAKDEIHMYLWFYNYLKGEVGETATVYISLPVKPKMCKWSFKKIISYLTKHEKEHLGSIDLSLVKVIEFFNCTKGWFTTITE